MPTQSSILDEQSLDSLLFNLESVRDVSGLSELVKLFLEGDYRQILQAPASQALYQNLVSTISSTSKDISFQNEELDNNEKALKVFITGLAAFNAFLQANVTGPPADWGNIFPNGSEDEGTKTREKCFRSLDVDGVSVYQHIPYVELFCLARMVFTLIFPRIIGSTFVDCKWMRVRINAYHQRLLAGLSGGKLSDSTMLQDLIDKDLKELEIEIMGEKSTFSTEAKVMFLLEKAQIYIMQGLDIKAKENVKMAKTVSGFSYALSGALGKRTKFQQKDISQLVVFAKSRHGESVEELSDALKESGVSKGPAALNLNDDTVLESIEYLKSDTIDTSALPEELKDLKPDEQPQLNPLDQITLLTEATLKDTLSPLDKLNSEEILPYAVRVLSDKPTNWQIYTQALLVRSRIESHRSRTLERSVLQLQVIVDQIIADTEEGLSSSPDGIPEIRVTSFLPRAKATESAPITERLRYIYPLNTPTRWELETELAYAWSGAGSLVSALEIFKRLKLWAEVALCYHAVGQEDKARQIIRRQLYHSSKGPEMDKYSIDAPEALTEKWDGEERSPPPPHAPRLWCILGDLDDNPTCWEVAWEISNSRYARAQRSLGDYWIKVGNAQKARDAYMAATVVNRQNNDTWSRLGDIDLRVGNWDGAVIAFQQSIMIDDTDAKTFSNLGSALLSKYEETRSLQKSEVRQAIEDDEDAEIDFSKLEKEKRDDPKVVLHQALQAYKRAAALAHSNWKIWSNVCTVALRIKPPSYLDLLLGFRNEISIRSPTMGENAVDIDILRALVREVITTDRREDGTVEGGIYTPPRGTLERAVSEFIDNEIKPLITKRYALWEMVEKICFWRRDYAEALKCAERGWRLAIQGEEWLVEKEGWEVVFMKTSELVDAYENYGGMEAVGGGEVEKGWKGKARSAVRGVMGKARDSWEASEGWVTLEAKLEELKR